MNTRKREKTRTKQWKTKGKKKNKREKKEKNLQIGGAFLLVVNDLAIFFLDFSLPLYLFASILYFRFFFKPSLSIFFVFFVFFV
jgi:hypothetical protein